MVDAFLRVREFDDSVEVFELDYILSHRGYDHLAHPGVSKQDKLDILNQEDGCCHHSLGHQLLQAGLSAGLNGKEPSKRKRMPSPARKRDSESGQESRQRSPDRKKNRLVAVQDELFDEFDNSSGSSGASADNDLDFQSNAKAEQDELSDEFDNSSGSSGASADNDLDLQSNAEAEQDELFDELDNSSGSSVASADYFDPYFQGNAQHVLQFPRDSDFYCSLQPDGPDNPRLVLVRDHAMACSNGIGAAFTTNMDTRLHIIRDFMKKADVDDNPGYRVIANELDQIALSEYQDLGGGNKDSDTIESFLHEMLNEVRPPCVQICIDQNRQLYGPAWEILARHHDQDCSVHATKIRNDKWSTRSHWTSPTAQDELGKIWSNDLNAIVDCKFASDEPVMKKLLLLLWTDLGQRKLVSKWNKSYQGSTISRAGANQYNIVPGGVINHNNAIERDNGLTKAECHRALMLVAKTPYLTCELVTHKTRKSKEMTWNDSFHRDVVSLKANKKAYEMAKQPDEKEQAGPLDVAFEHNGTIILPTLKTLNKIFHMNLNTGASFPRTDILRIRNQFNRGKFGRRLRMYKLMQDGDGEGVAESIRKLRDVEIPFYEYVAIQNAFVTLTPISNEEYTQSMCNKFVNASFQLGKDIGQIVAQANIQQAFMASNCKTFYMRGLCEYTVAKAFRDGLLSHWPSNRSPLNLPTRTKRTKSHEGEALMNESLLQKYYKKKKKRSIGNKKKQKRK